MRKVNLSESKTLRQKAEAKLNASSLRQAQGIASPIEQELATYSRDMLKLIHELEVYQVELEMQNEELLLAKAKTELAEEKYTNLFDFAPSGYLLLTRNSTITELNFAAANMLGKERSHLVDKRFAAFISEETLSVFNGFLDRVFSSSYTQTCEVSISTTGNLPVYLSMEGIINQDGKICFLTVVDISSRKLVEEALAENNEILSLSYANAPICTFIKEVTATENRVLRASNNFVDMVGISGSDMVGKTMHEIFPATLAAQIIADDWTVVSEGRVIQFDEELNGRTYTTIKYPILLRGKMLLGGFTIDNTVRKQALKAEHERLISLVKILQNNDETIKEILDFTLEQALLLTYSKIGYIYFYDEQLQEFTLFSWSKQVMKECSVAETKTRYNLSETGVWGEAVRQKKPILINDFNAPHPSKKGYPEGHAHLDKFLTIPVQIDGKTVAVIGVGNKETDYDETDVLHLTILMDSAWKVIQKKEVDELLEKQNVELRQLNVTKDKFFSIIAHDLKSPFNSILGFSEILVQQMKAKDYESVDDYARIILGSAKRVVELQTNLLVWARSQSGRMEFNPEYFEMADYINDMMPLFTDMAGQKSINITTTLVHPISAFAYRPMISTILGNLVSNAIKYTRAGGEISISAKQDTGGITVSVADNGIGISRDGIGKLFRIEESYSTKGTNNEEGTGLGLILCKEFVEKHGGKIGVESEPGKGSTFYFTLPFSTISEQKPDIQLKSSTNAIRYQDKKLKILIVEDDEVSEMLLVKDLKTLDKQILKALNGVDAVEICRMNPDIDLVLMDIRLPLMDGYEATRKIREFNKDVIIVAQTAYALTGDREKSLKAGCNDYITKPIIQSVLLELIQMHFKKTII
jgi:PAS domain S-box-containing protein